MQPCGSRPAHRELQRFGSRHHTGFPGLSPSVVTTTYHRARCPDHVRVHRTDCLQPVGSAAVLRSQCGPDPWADANGPRREY